MIGRLRRSFAPGLVLAMAGTALLVVGCHAPEARSAVDPERREMACSPTGDADRGGVKHTALPPSDTVYRLTGERVTSVRIEGRRELPEAVLREAVKIAPGTLLDAAALDRDVRALVALEVLEDVWVEVAPEAGGVAVVYSVSERPFVNQVFVVGGVPGDTGTFFFPVAGDVHDPAALRRAASDLEGRLVRLGYLDASVKTHTHRLGPSRADLCLAVDAGPAYHVRKLAFSGNHAFSDAEMRKAMAEGLEESDRGKVNTEGGVFRADLLERESLFLDSTAYERGLVQWAAEAPRVTRSKTPAGEGVVDIVIRVQEGPVFHLSKVAFSGALAAPADTYAALVDVHEGEVFSRKKLFAIVERADELHKDLERPELKVTPGIRTEGDLVSVDLHVEGASP